jgi:hypothetical protein
LRDQLTGELKDLNSAEEAANWARRAIAVKNTLTAADAEGVEQAFDARLAALATEPECWKTPKIIANSKRPS